jgi:hypothetical protein
MFETLSALPLPFWVVMVLMAWGTWLGIRELRSGLGLPVLAVLGTLAAWYVGDALYNDYSAHHAQMFSSEILSGAWWQVALFCAVFLALAVPIHLTLNAAHKDTGSKVVQLVKSGVGEPALQEQMERLFYACAVLWVVLSLFALMRLGGEIIYYFFPFLGHRAEPWGRGRIGGGIDWLLGLASYLHLLVASCFGLTAALSRNKTIGTMALAGCALSWPYILFGTARNYMLTATMPGIAGWILLRLRLSVRVKALLLAGSLFAVHFWLSFVIANRSSASIVEALRDGEVASERTLAARHEGLNMFEELCWINAFIVQRTYEPDWGKRYFAELVNPIPRALWREKPTIGIDYAVARGQAQESDGGETAGVYATVSTGIIGQGVVNFGRIAGPACAAVLMAVWAAILARLDLTGSRFGRVPLFGIGLMLTFNLGRDITLITLYPFVFGYVLVKALGEKLKN